MAFDSAAPINRRTVAKGIAWSVPAVAVAGAAPAFATSHEEPPTPVFNWTNAVKNPGGSCKIACVPKQSYGVPVTVSNPTEDDVFIKAWATMAAFTTSRSASRIPARQQSR